MACASSAFREVFLAPPIEEAIAVINDGQGIEGIEHPGPERTPGIFRRSLAHAFGPKAGAGPVGHGLVKGNAGDRDINAGEIAGVFAAHEGERAGIGRLPLGALDAFAAKGFVTRKPGHLVEFEGHDLLRKHKGIVGHPGYPNGLAALNAGTAGARVVLHIHLQVRARP